MKHELKKIEHSAVEIKVTLTAEELSPIKSEVIKTLATKVEVPGFRKGHAPLNKVEAAFADAIKEEVVESVLKANFEKIVAEEKITPVSFIYDLVADMKDTLEMTFKVDVYPEITLGEYKGLEVEKESFEMTDDLLNKEIENMLNAKSKLEDAPEGHKAEMGNTVDLAFEGFVDGVPFEGGKADSHQLKLGSKMFIDNFEDQLVGYTVGQEGDVNVTFPAEYHAEALAGKPATFKVKINSIKTLAKPELTEEFAKEAGFESVEDLKAKKTAEIVAREEARVKNNFVGKLIQKVVADSKVEVPKSMVVREVENRMAEMNQQLAMQGMDLDQYLKMTGMTKEQAFNQIAPMAHNKVQVDLVLEAIAKAENLEVTAEELNTKVEEIAKMYGMTKEQLEAELKKNSNLEEFNHSLKTEALAQKAVDVIVNNAK
ncbi:trigger factor [Candidatus Cetobacterium colombiensis]|jgi:trigger factor|uniref:Trigger factor n=1 Tax=Candidatus Cetobacterium colombiensis TaxID=3073100 RepID=A0ABU4WAH0_9FUSO|nr:trigger factor [Candidatus Cetobacterium colombiensis]MDX8335483.1 trigger factor [Candidatus Cetobacterium colombiensis]